MIGFIKKVINGKQGGFKDHPIVQEVKSIITRTIEEVTDNDFEILEMLFQQIKKEQVPVVYYAQIRMWPSRYSPKTSQRITFQLNHDRGPSKCIEDLSMRDLVFKLEYFGFTAGVFSPFSFDDSLSLSANRV